MANAANDTSGEVTFLDQERGAFRVGEGEVETTSNQPPVLFITQPVDLGEIVDGEMLEFSLTGSLLVGHDAGTLEGEEFREAGRSSPEVVIIGPIEDSTEGGNL